MNSVETITPKRQKEKLMTQHDYSQYFPHSIVRAQQDQALQFTLDAFLMNGKRFVILELGTGCGKSAIGVTAARYMNANVPKDEAFLPGAYTLTTQKVLQKQYMNDFGPPKGGMLSIQSATNFQCNFYPKNNCAESINLLRGEKKGTPFWSQCVFNCCYKEAKKAFIASPESITNFSYFLAETMYGKQLKPRQLLVIDECHNIESELGKFVEVTIHEKFTKETLKVDWPAVTTQAGIIKWIRGMYLPRLEAHITHLDTLIEARRGLKEKLDELIGFAKMYDMLDKHICKINRFIGMYDDGGEDNWVMNYNEAKGRSLRNVEFKPVDVAPYSEELLFRFGQKVIMMSATIIDKDVFCRSVGIPMDQVEFLSIDSPFPIENRPILYYPAGSMSKENIDKTLPNLVNMIEALLEEHKKEKGIIHCHTYKIADYIKNNIKSSRLLLHNSSNREEIVKKHFESTKPTVLLSPSLSEGIDLKDDLSRWQVICKIPYPYLGDKIVRKRMHKDRDWYPFQTAKIIIQSIGRSVRSDTDQAVTYILDENWQIFFNKYGNMFPESFKKALKT